MYVVDVDRLELCKYSSSIVTKKVEPDEEHLSTVTKRSMV